MTAARRILPELSVLASFLVLTGCGSAEPSPQAPTDRIELPVFDLVQAAEPGVAAGWSPAGSSARRPALSFYQNGRPGLVMTCQGTQTRMQVRGLQPQQAWPQPDLTLRFGPVARTVNPDVRNIGSQVAYEVQFSIADDVLDQLAAGAPISVDFNAQSRTFEPIPEEQRRSFAQACAALVPAGMRRAGA